MIRPEYKGRPLKEIKKYPNFILFEDTKTGIRTCISYFDLGYRTPNLKKSRPHLNRMPKL